jgi:GT2 family glycosyltransferase/glycosyltransferase involved in cell wall biosynthesis
MTSPSGERPIDVVVPVYNAPDDLRRCVASVLACTARPFRLVLIDDASPDSGVRDVFREFEQRGDPRIALLANPRNVGFTATANRGMTASRADVVLLNSDTIVTRGWLDALARCAASDPRIATVTPFSNNAEICSFPRFCEDNPWPDDADPEPVRAALASAAVPTYPDLPTGVGFCMFVRREAIQAIGTFDLAFGAGYGEENDFCLRAARAGWRNVLADDAFVVHAGGRSFAGRKAQLGRRNLERLLGRHPHYADMVERYIAGDPLRALRQAAQSRLASGEPTRGVLHVIHHHGGGTETHVRALIAASRESWRHYLVVAVGDHWQLEEHRRDRSIVTFSFARARGESWHDFLAGLTATFGISLVHLHNISACREGLMQALEHASVPFGYTLHDLNFACPTITFLDRDGRYCGGVTDRRACQACVEAQPAFAGVNVSSWRERHAALVERAAFVIAPSQWASTMFHRYFARTDVAVIPHGTAAPEATPAYGLRLAALLPDDGVPVVAALGAIGPDKGARRIEHLIALIGERRIALRIVVIGYLDVQQGPWQSDDARLTVHGRYDSRDLPALLHHYRARLVLFPSAGPETFSYTLSEAWRAGMPALVPPIGALAERVSASGAGWVLTDDEWRDDVRMLDRVVALAGDAARDARAHAAANARAVAHASPQQMADATLAHYDAAVAGRPAHSAGARFTNLRVRDALGYHAWTPPEPTSAESGDILGPRMAAHEDTGWMARFARRALAIRRTPIGRVLYRMTPAPVIDALKARLDG